MIAVGYCRFSSENQADGFSIEAQKNAIKEFCKKEGHQILRFYVDEAKTGTTTEGRTSFLEMLDDSKKKQFELVIVHKLDRFARSRIDSAISKQVLKENGVKVISVLEHLDDSPESIILESVLEGMNEYYSQNLSRETKKGQRVAVAKGRVLGTVPYGYTTDQDKKPVIVPEEASVVKTIFNQFADGIQLATIARLLKERGIKTRAGNDFSLCSITIIIKNPFYTGDYKFGDNIYPNFCEPIIDRELFNKCQTRFKPRIRHKDKGSLYLLTGILFHSCGQAMTGYKSYKKGKVYQYYRCRNKEPNGFIKKDIAEKTIVDCLLTFLSEEKILKDLSEALSKKIKQTSQSKDAAQLKKQINDLKEQDSKLLDLYLSGTIDKALYTAKKTTIDNSIKLYSNQLSACLNAIKFTPSALKMAFDYYKFKIKNSLLESNSIQAIITTFVKKVVLFDDRFEITFQFKDMSVAYRRDNAPALPCLVATFSYKGKNELMHIYYKSVTIADAISY